MKQQLNGKAQEPRRSTKSPTAVDQMVGANIRKFRLLAGLSQEKLADHLGVTFQQVQKYEKGTNRIAPSRILSMSHLFGQPLSAFYEGADAATQGEPNPVMDMMTTSEGVRLATVFSQVKDPTIRQRLIGVIEAISEAAVSEGGQPNTVAATPPAPAKTAQAPRGAMAKLPRGRAAAAGGQRAAGRQ